MGYPSLFARRLTTAVWWVLATVALAGAIGAAFIPIEWDDTSTSVFNGFHRYMVATALREAFAAVVVLLLGSAACSVLAGVAARGFGASVYRRVALALAVVGSLLVVLWLASPPPWHSAK